MPLLLRGHRPGAAAGGLAHPSICPYGAFPTRDGALVLLSIQNEREWVKFCAAFLRQPDLPSRPGFESNTARVANRPEVDAVVARVFSELSRDEAADRLRAAGTAYGFVNGLSDLVSHPALRRVTVETHAGPASIVAPPALRNRPGPGAGSRAGDRRAQRGDPAGIRSRVDHLAV